MQKYFAFMILAMCYDFLKIVPLLLLSIFFVSEILFLLNVLRLVMCWTLAKLASLLTTLFLHL